MKARVSMVAAGCVALAAASLLIPSAPTTDPWGWIVWGREIGHLQLSTAIGGAPSWKPLPVLFTTPLSAFGGSAPDLWLVVARAAGLLGLVAAFRLGSRAAGRSAGVLAVAGVLLSEHWIRSFMHGYSEPLAIALLLIAVDRHWSGREREALLLLGAVALARPEAFPLVLVYGLLTRHRSGLAALAAVGVLVPALWLIPDWIGSGDPFHGGHVASALEPRGASAALAALLRGLAIAPLPLTLTAVAGGAIATRQADRRVAELSAAAAAWVALLFALKLAGYPASGRFYVLPAALVCVLGAIGAVRIARVPGPEARAAGLAALAALPLVVSRAAASADEARDSVRRADLELSLAGAIDRAGAHSLRSCGRPVVPRGLSWLRGDVAWQLRMPLGGVRSVITTGRGYIASLSDTGTAAPAARVVARRRHPRAVVLEPFGSRQVRWRIHADCRRVPTRAA